MGIKHDREQHQEWILGKAQSYTIGTRPHVLTCPLHVLHSSGAAPSSHHHHYHLCSDEGQLNRHQASKHRKCRKRTAQIRAQQEAPNCSLTALLVTAHLQLLFALQAAQNQLKISRPQGHQWESTLQKLGDRLQLRRQNGQSSCCTLICSSAVLCSSLLLLYNALRSPSLLVMVCRFCRDMCFSSDSWADCLSAASLCVCLSMCAFPQTVV